MQANTENKQNHATLQFSLVSQHFPTSLQFCKDLKDIWVKFVFPYQDNNRERTGRGGGEAREEAELTSFSLGFSGWLLNCKWISHWGLMSVFLPDVDQESSEAHAVTPRKKTSLGFALLGFVC